MNEISIKPIDSGGKKMQYRDKNTEAYALVKNQLRSELIDSRGDHTTDWNKLSQTHYKDAGKHIDNIDKIEIQCPVPRICCNQRDQNYRYGCIQEDRDCALNMILKTDFDNIDDEDDEDDEDDSYIEDDPIEFD